MTRSPARPRPVPVRPLPLQQVAVAGPGPRARRGRGARHAPLARFRPAPSGRAAAADPGRPARPPGRRRADQPAAGPPARGVSRGDDRRAGLAEQPRGLRGRPARRPRPAGRAQLVRAKTRALGAGDGGLGARPLAARRGLRPRHRRAGRHPDGARPGPGRHPAAGRLGDGRGRVPADRRGRWVPGRHEVGSRLALLERLGLPDRRPPRVVVSRRPTATASLVGHWLREAWPDAAAPRPSTPDGPREAGATLVPAAV